MEHLDDTILDNIRLEDLNIQKKSPNETNKQISHHNNNHHHHHHNSKFKYAHNKYHSKSNDPTKHNNLHLNNKKSKRLPWNTEILKDRFTPQPFQIQLIDYYLKNILNQKCQTIENNLLIFIRNKEWKNYFKIATIKHYIIKLKEIEIKMNKKKYMILITNMGSDVSKYVELISRHTFVKIAGIDSNLINNPDFKSNTQSCLLQLKKDAQILIMNISILLDWFKKSYLTIDEIALILIEDVCSAFHNDSYNLLMDKYYKIENESNLLLPNIIGFGSLEITRTTNKYHIKNHIDFLKDLFRCNIVETATDLLDTHNLFNGYEPKESIKICDNVDLLNLNTTFQVKLVDKIKNGYLFLEELYNVTLSNYSTNNNENLSYIHLLCVRVLNECVYLLNEVGIWCLAKSLSPFICQLDKLSNSDKSLFESDDENIISLNNSNTHQILILKYTSTLLRELREMCIKQFLGFRINNPNVPNSNLSSLDYFLINFTTPKVRSLINLLKNSSLSSQNITTDEFCSLIFVQNKQVATSLSLLIKKLSKEDSSLSYLYPNYIIGPSNINVNSNNNSNSNATENGNLKSPSNNQNVNNEYFKQEEILRKFYSGEINLLICTYEMEERIQSPNCVNLIIRFNCTVSTGSETFKSNSNQNFLQSNNSNSAVNNDYLPFDYFSYISTKTRAKTKNSCCYFFIEKNQFDSFFIQFSKFKQIENLLAKNYSKLIDLNKPILNTSEYFSNKSLSHENCIYYINKYCIRLPSDALTQLTPKLEIKTRSIDDQIEYKCILYLPINSGVRDPIECDWEKDLNSARLNVSLNACLILFKFNEVTEMMEPITKEIFYKQKHKPDADDEKEWSQFNSYFEKSYSKHSNLNENLNQQISNYMSNRPGGNKRKQIYKKKISPCLSTLQLVNTQIGSYLYAIKCVLTTSLSQETQNIKPKKNWCFGLLTSKPLLEIVDFPIFTQNGEETVSLELVKNSLYLSPKQLKLIKIFHKFIFSNVLRMEGRGAIASQVLNNITTNKQTDQTGFFICLLEDDTNEFEWDLMASVEGCTDRTLIKTPTHAKKFLEEEQNEEEITENGIFISKEINLNDLKCLFNFDESKYIDSVVIPFYRNTDLQPQFYCVTSIDYTLNPLSPFPVSSSSKASAFETFFQYFAYKYNILITNLTQPLLIVNHPSTRLNLLTPRYMNMRASVLQKSYHQSMKSDKKSTNNQIYLIPELVNLHPLSAHVWRRSLCLPSILYRINSLMVAEELRREIAKTTGVGVPWISENQKFEKLTFVWDANKEIEISNIPDQEIDIASIENEKKISSSIKLDILERNDYQVDSNWDFEISEWDANCIKEVKSNKKSKLANLNLGFENNLFIVGESNGMNGNGWNDGSNFKTLFIDPNDMNFFAEDIESDLEDEDYYEEEPKKKQAILNSDGSEIDELEQVNNHVDYADFQENNDLQLKFTIDLNTLKADMKKKSAKLLSKLSINSNNCSLVKSLVKNVNEQLMNNTDFNHETNSFSNQEFSLANLTSDLNLNYLNKSNECNKKLFEVLDLNELDLRDWLQNIEFIFDFNTDEPNDLNFISNIQNLKQNLNKNECVSVALNNGSMDSDLKNKKICLPLNRQEIQKLVPNYSKQEIEKKSETNEKKFNSNFDLRNTNWSFNFSLDDNHNTANSINELGPGPAILLQALTLSHAADGFDLERLETVGDSFLKQAITVYLFFTYPNIHEGKLSFLRSKQVSNYNLYKLGKRKGLHELIISTKFEPLDSWLPPLYESVISNEPENFFQTMFCKLNKIQPNQIKTSEKQNQQKFDKYNDHILSDKSIADCVESIIGAYLITSGPHAALLVMSWFGLQVLPKAKCEDGSEVLVNLPQVPPPKINDYNKLEELLYGYESFEACIGYKFNQPAYLLQAFTHSSYTYNTVTDCYQRLEFLGDAILDYVITRHLYEDKKRHSPGELTDLRSALVNNNIFAYLAVKYEFYKYFKYSSPVLYQIIDKFVQNQKNRNDEFDLEEDFFDYAIDDEDDEYYLLMNNPDDLKSSNEFDNSENYQTYLPQTNELEELEVPKCLGDIFESVAGAIFLDSNKSFDTVWRVYYGLMKPHIDKFTSQVPKSPIRELLELEPETAKFEKPERTIDGKIRVTVSVFGRGKFKGLGRNYRIAKNAAAKLALKFLKGQNSSE